MVTKDVLETIDTLVLHSDDVKVCYTGKPSANKAIPKEIQSLAPGRLYTLAAYRRMTMAGLEAACVARSPSRQFLTNQEQGRNDRGL